MASTMNEDHKGIMSWSSIALAVMLAVVLLSLPHLATYAYDAAGNPPTQTVPRRGEVKDELVAEAPEGWEMGGIFMSPDNNSTAVVARNKGDSCVIIGDKTIRGYSNISATWSPDGKMFVFCGYKDHNSNDSFVVIDGREVAGPLKNVTSPAFTTDGRLWYCYKDTGGFWLQKGNQKEKIAVPDGVQYLGEEIAVAPDGAHWAVVVSGDSGYFVIRDGKVYGQHKETCDLYGILADGTILYNVKTGPKGTSHKLRIGDNKFSDLFFSMAMFAPTLSPDQKHFAVAMSLGQYLTLIVDGEKVKETNVKEGGYGIPVAVGNRGNIVVLLEPLGMDKGKFVGKIVAEEIKQHKRQELLILENTWPVYPRMSESDMKFSFIYRKDNKCWRKVLDVGFE